MAVTYGMSCDLQNGKRNARVSEMGSRRNKIAIEWNRATGKVHKIIKWQLSATESTSKTTLLRRDIEVQVQVILLLFACICKKLGFQNVFPPHENEKSVLVNFLQFE